MAVTAAMVKELREMTGAGMMDCKKALTATEGDMDAAVEFLRKNGQAKAEKKAGRIAAEGLCRVAVKDEGTAAVVEVNSETDFVAKNEKFQNFVAAVAEQAVNSDNTELEAFLDEAWHEEPSKTVKEVLVEQIAVIGENLKIRRFQKVTAPLVVSYTHGGGRIGVLVEADTDVKNDAVKEALTNVAMQIAALSPKYVSTADVSEEYKAHEKEILMAQIQNDPKMAGKPEKVIEGAVSGRNFLYGLRARGHAASPLCRCFSSAFRQSAPRPFHFYIKRQRPLHPGCRFRRRRVPRAESAPADAHCF